MYTIFFDSYCKMCTTISNEIQHLDKENKFNMVSFREKQILAEFNINDEMSKKMEQRLFLYDEVLDKWYEGIQAIHIISKNIKKYKLFSPFIFLSIKFGIGQKCYDFIASRRIIIPTGHCKNGMCDIDFDKKK